jgi:hypothetical protein
LLASRKSMNTGYKNQWLGQWSWVPGPALKGRPGTTGEFFRSPLGRGCPDSGHAPAEQNRRGRSRSFADAALTVPGDNLWVAGAVYDMIV